MGARLALVLVGLLAGVACLAVAELALRLVGAGEGPPAYDPFSGFSAAVPLFEPARREDGTGVYRVSPARLVRPADAATEPEREFLAEKPENGFRVFVVGGSSAAGFPYPPAYAFSSWLGQRLQASFPELAVEVVNAAVAGYSSRRVLLVVRELVRYDPDLVVVYSGHNEWAEQRYYSRLIDMHPVLFRLRERLFTTRLFNLASHRMRRERKSPDATLERFMGDQQREFSEMFAVFSRRVEGSDYATPEQVAQRDKLYRLNLEEIVRTAQAAGAHVVLMTLSQNFADWAPGASSHGADLSVEQEALWGSHFAQGEAAAQGGDCEAALEAWERALALDGEHALLHYRIAQCHRVRGAWPAARAHYRRASDLDAVPHGAPEYFNDVIRGVAGERGALLVDADAALAAESEQGLVGDDLFIEFAHPNLRGQQVIAGALADGLREAAIPGAWGDRNWTDPDPATLQAAPGLRERELEAIRFTCVVARRPECVAEQVEALRLLRERKGP